MHVFVVLRYRPYGYIWDIDEVKLNRITPRVQYPKAVIAHAPMHALTSRFFKRIVRIQYFVLWLC